MSDEDTRSIDDDAMLASVGEMLEATEPLRAELVDQIAAEAFAMRRIDAFVAELVHDSAAASGGMRAADSFRTISFAAEGVEIEVQFTDDGRTIHGRVDPPGLRCVIEADGEERQLTLDRFGRFTTETTSGRLRFVVTLDSARIVATPSIFR